MAHILPMDNVDITEIKTLNQNGVLNLKTTLSACSDLAEQVTTLNSLVGGFRV